MKLRRIQASVLSSLLVLGAAFLMLVPANPEPAAAQTFCSLAFPPSPPPPVPPAPPCHPGGPCCGQCSAARPGTETGGGSSSSGSSSSGSSSSGASGSESPVQAAPGSYFTSERDMAVPSTGMPLSIARTYNGSSLGDGLVGIGWSITFSARMSYRGFAYASPTIPRNEAVITMPSGVTYRFIENPDGTFTGPRETRDRLVRNPDGTADVFVGGTRAFHRFSSTGALTGMTDELGNALVLTYDGNGRIQRIADAAGSGRYVDVFFGPDGRISTLRDSANRQVRYTYDGQGKLITVMDPLDHNTTYTYAPARFGQALSRVTDHWGRVLTDVTYDSLGRVQTYTSAGETYTMGYDVFQGNEQPYTTTTTNSLGRGSWVVTNAAGQVTLRAKAFEGSTDYQYDADGKLTLSMEHPSNVSSAYTYDTAGRVSTVTRAQLSAERVRHDYTYDANFPDKVTDIVAKNPDTGLTNPDWQSTRYDYYPPGSTSPGALHHVYRIRTDGTPETTATYVYDAAGRVTSQADGAGAETTYSYDPQGNLFTVTAPANNDAGIHPVTTYGYDALGRVLSVTDPLGHATAYTYDGNGRVLTVTLPKPSAGSPLDFTTRYVYDVYDAASGLLFTEITDPNGRLTRLGYDQFGRLVKSIDASSHATIYASSHGRLDSVTDANGNVTSYAYAYGAGGNSMTTTFPDGKTEWFTSTPNGAPQNKTDRLGTFHQYSQDLLGRRLAWWAGGQLPEYGHQYNNYYTGQKLGLVRSAGSVPPFDAESYAYDSSFRVSSRTQGPGTLTSTYDAADRVQTAAIVGGPSSTYTYYPDGSLNTIDWSPLGGQQIKYSYDLAGRTSRIDFPGGYHRDYAYDDQGRLLQVSNTMPGGTSTAYGYDVDNATGLYTMLGQRTSANGTTYYYDALYQLTRANYGPGSTESWTYDSIGNRLTKSVNGTVQTYTYLKNGSNSLNGQKIQSDGTNAFTFDFVGNLKTKSGPGGSFTFMPGFQDRTVSISGSATATYEYDPLDRRMSKTTPAGSTYYLYDGMNLVGEGSGFPITSGGSPTYYLFGPGVDEPLAMTKSGQVSYFAVDGLGSVTAETRSDGTVQHTATYDAWGNITAETGTRQSSFGYTAREYGEAGLWYYRARYYDPSIGRFTQEDPIQDSGYAITSLYSYVANMPTWLTDPSGKLFVDPTPASGGVNQLVCDGNDGFYIIANAYGGEEGLRCGLKECILIHENIHLRQYKKAAPNICRGAKLMWQINYSSRSEEIRFEKPAYYGEAQCLVRLMEADPADKSCCKATRKSRLKQVLGIITDMGR